MQIFHTNCTYPPETAGFVSSPNTQGTLDIVWSCLSVIGLCTWSMLHLNVPIQSTPSTKRQKYLRTLWRFSSKLKWMMINIIAPEWAFGSACSDVSSVRMLKARFADIQERDGVPWSDSHIHYANMGGFPIQFVDSNATAGTQEIPSIKKFPKGIRTPQILQISMQKISNAIGKVDWALDRSNILAIERANSMVSQGYLKKERFLNMSYTNWVGNLTLLCGNLWVVDANQLLLARELGIIDKLPYMSQDSLDGHNNGDLVVKILALLQISWMFIQLGVRLGRNLPASKLEIFTLSFAICSSITYIMLIDKPQDVRTSCTIKAVRHPSAEDLICMANAGSVGNVFKSNVWIPNDAMHRDAVRKVPGYMISLVYFFAFGATHCIAWNFEFPTAVERLLWRLSSVVTAVALPIAYLISDPFWLKVFKLETQPRILELVEGSLLILTVVVFILARLFITVEVFRSLAFLPPGAFIGTWTANIPHVG
ncbi:hypothetical protein PENSOL_c051G08202 [Penicillium solitum]|uniref:Uncharacterized protein n=1 Tax=Penicillium solitum TaxID=60172 RepID=A0A1V6QQY8_9EURO|nr:uncharacterized protein PENSOL_c051G08202 [Penicillium solitum]OQD91633.1 hypothetical protein PENSOL_c051G08202 [Penicillium solitum]